jgi:hypothetical protein
MIRRLKCQCCGRLHNELPDFIQPYKRYTSDVIEAVLDDDTSASPAENSTIKRWRKWFNRIDSYLNAALVAIKCNRRVGMARNRRHILRDLDAMSAVRAW